MNCVSVHHLIVVHAKIIFLRKALYVCFVDIEKFFDRVPWKVLEWAMRKKEIPEVLARSVMRSV